MNTYTMEELIAHNIDSWVNAVSKIAEKYGYLVDGYNSNECPADYESEFRRFAIALKMRFYEDGEIASHQRVPATALKPCPCCSGVAIVETDGQFAWIECYDCGIRTTHYDLDWDDDALYQASKTWNKRNEVTK
jgi:hypothetical protein